MVDAPEPGRGTLRVYLGAAPGVGKTYAMLDEGSRRAGRGTDVVIGFVETHGRAGTAERIGGLEVVGRRVVDHHGGCFEELDLAAVLARRPAVALIDELAHSNVGDGPNEKRWQDVEELLAAGIDVISTVNIQHLESLNDVVERLTGIRQQETVPDAFVRRAQQIQLVDSTPEALRRRMAHGNIYPAERIDTALANFFRTENLAALRELALLWLADRVEENLDAYLETHGHGETSEIRERVVVAVSSHSGDHLIRRAARLAERRHGSLVAVHVTPTTGLAEPAGPALESHRRLVADLGGRFHELSSDDIAAAVAEFATTQRATQIVIGASRRSAWSELVGGSFVRRLLQRSGHVDLHVIAEPGPTPPPGPQRRRRARLQRLTTPLAPARVRTGWAMALPGLAVLALALASVRDQLSLTTVSELLLAWVIGASAVGGLAPGVTASLAASLALNYFFTPPLRTFTIGDPDNAVSLAVFVLVSLIVSLLVDRIARRSHEAAQARLGAEALARTAAALVTGGGDIGGLLEEIRESVQASGAALVNAETPDVAIASTGTFALSSGAVTAPVGADGLSLVLDRPAHRVDHRLLAVLADHVAAALESTRLREESREADRLAEIDTLRTAILRSVSHDLRTPLTATKAAVSTLLQPDLRLDDAAVTELLQSIDQSTDRLDRVVANLLDLSRLEVGALKLRLEPTLVGDVVAGALRHLEQAAAVVVALPKDLPLVVTDPVLLERAVTNLLSNALVWSPAGSPVRVDAGSVRGPDSSAGGRRGTGYCARGAGAGGASLPAPGRALERRGCRSWARSRQRLRQGNRRQARTRGVAGRWAHRHHQPPARHRAERRCSRRRRWPAMTRILVVDDEPQILRAIAINLRAQGYTVDLAQSGEVALSLAAANHPDLVLLDLGLPGIDGTEVIFGLRGWTEVPIIVLSARDTEADKVAALDLGADDYLAKPFGMGELTARLRAVLRRRVAGEEAPVVIHTEHFTIDYSVGRVTAADGAEIHLTPTEWSILKVTARHPGKLVTQRALLDAVWGLGHEDRSGFLRVHLNHLRYKLEPDPTRPRYFVTEPGIGYRFQTDS